jgi:hypothetical protein
MLYRGRGAGEFCSLGGQNVLPKPDGDSPVAIPSRQLAGGEQLHALRFGARSGRPRRTGRNWTGSQECKLQAASERRNKQPLAALLAGARWLAAKCGAGATLRRRARWRPCP